MVSKKRFTWVCSGQNRYVNIYEFDEDPGNINPNEKLRQEDLDGATKYSVLRDTTEVYESALLVGAANSENVIEYMEKNFSVPKRELDALIARVKFDHGESVPPEMIFRKLSLEKGLGLSERMRLVAQVRGEFEVLIARALAGLDEAPSGDVKKVVDGFKAWAAYQEKSCQKTSSKSHKKSSTTSS
jgi:hypothetical protein